MPSLRILNVGQCGFDQANIRRALAGPLDAEIVAVDSEEEALDALGSQSFHLVLVNRLADIDGRPGLGLIRSMKADARHGQVPVMMVSNFASAQQEAVAAGAVPGFGKADLGSGKDLEAIRNALSS